MSEEVALGETEGDDQEVVAINELYVEQIFDDEAALEEERPKKRKITRNKRKKIDASSRTKRFKTDPNESAEAKAQKSLIADTLFGCADVVEIVFSYLDVRQLLRFLFVSKEFKNLLTYDHVVRSTMITGGFPLTNLEKLIPPMRDRKIWIPSPVRLLKTVCGKRCENCDWRNRFVCDSFGVFWCKRCLKNSTKLFRRTNQSKDYLDAPRISLGPRKASAGKSVMYLILTPVKDVGGNHYGPLVTAQDLEAMMAKDEKDDESTTPAEKVAAWIQKCDDQQPHADAAVKSILEALEESRQDAVNRRATIREEKEEARELLGDARRKLSNKVTSNLMDLLQHDPGILAVLKKKRWSPRDNQYTFEEYVATQLFGDSSEKEKRKERKLAVHRIVKALLTPIFKAPSKYSSKKKLQPVVDQIRSVKEEKKLMEKYIQQIVEHCGQPDTHKLLERHFMTRKTWRGEFTFSFEHPLIKDILGGPLSKPRDLTEGHVQQLAEQVKKIVFRKRRGEEILQKLEQRLKDLPSLVQHMKDRKWNVLFWRWGFRECYVEDVLQEPISKPEDITEELLNELEQTLRTTIETKKLVKDRMELLRAFVAKKNPEWYSKMEDFHWSPKSNLCHFDDYEAYEIMKAGDVKLEHVEQMDDGRIEELSNQILAEIEEYEAN